jgi:hypothetical protein
LRECLEGSQDAPEWGGLQSVPLWRIKPSSNNLLTMPIHYS